MATVPLTSPFSLKNATLSIDVDDYTAAVTQVEFQPSTSTAVVRTIDGKAHKDQSTAEWNCVVGYVQDLAPNSLLRYLLDHDGEKKTAVFTPVAEGPTITAELTVSPGNVGGATGNAGMVTGTVTLASSKPEFADPTP